MRPIAVEARDGYRIWLRYSDGAAGEVDLSHLAGRGVFAAWGDRTFFEAVRLEDHGTIAWGEGALPRCPLYAACRQVCCGSDAGCPDSG